MIPLQTPLAFDRRRAEARIGEPWGARLWLGAGLVLLIALLLQSYGISTWPMADDEVPSLVELGILHNGAERFFSVPPSQIPRLPKATIVWNTFQRHAIALLPITSEVRFRLPSLICGVITAVLVFVFAARARGLWFGAALALLVNTSHTFVYLSPLNRFYALPMLLTTLTFGAMWIPGGSLFLIGGIVVLSALAVLSHNIVLPLFVMAAGASTFLWMVGRGSLTMVLRAAAAAVTSVAIYLLYLLPLVRGWSSTGNPTPVFVSFAAHATMPALALALFGGWLALVRPDQGDSMLWWLLIFAGSFVCFQFAPVTWNPRYFVFYMAAMWVLGAHAMEFVARRIGFGSLGVVWYAAVVVLMMPFLASHYQDGSRHDYRAAAAILKENARPNELLLSDDAETISYYLPADMIAHLQVRTRVTVYPPDEFLVVYRGNAWAPVPQIRGRQMQLLGEIYKRRFDQFSHVLRVYRVAPEGPA